MTDIVSTSDLPPDSLRTKSEYYTRSRELGIPIRCPILKYCERRIATINIWLDRTSHRVPTPTPAVPQIEDIGLAGGDNNFFVYGLCPEVAAFETGYSIAAFGGMPVTKDSYDKYMDPQYYIKETGHFSDCPEYDSFIHNPLIIDNASKFSPNLLNANDAHDIDSALAILDKIAKKFPAIVSQFSKRRKNRDPLIMNDEYDVQYLFQSLLSIYFKDIRPEEMGPSVSGGSARADCLLKTFGIVIEFKMSRRNYSAVQLRKELADDFVTYGQHPDCRALFVFVYDPDKYIENPAGVEADLSVPRPPINIVRTVVQQS